MMRPKPLLPHRRDSAARMHVKGGRKIDRNDRIPFFQRKLINRSDMLNSGIVDENIEPAVLLHDVGDHP